MPSNIHLIALGQPFSTRNLRVHVLNAGERGLLPVQHEMHGQNAQVPV